jgi:hypothetical protein
LQLIIPIVFLKSFKLQKTYTLCDPKRFSGVTMEIGGFFEFPKFDSIDNHHSSTYHYLINLYENYSFFRDGRQAIKAVLQNTDEIKNRPCYLPSYLPDSVIQPFKEMSLNISFFGHEDPLKPILNTDIDNSLIFFIDYFGTESVSNQEIRELLDRDNIVIMDLSHSIFDKNRFSIKHNDYYLIASLRKIFPIPDGGIVYHNNEKFFSSDIFPKGYESELEAMALKYLDLNGINVGNVPTQDDKKLDSVFEASYAKKPVGFNKYLEAIKKHYLALHHEYELKKQQKQVIPQNIPAISLYILHNISHSNIINTRAKNLKFMYENIIYKNLFVFNFEDIKSPYLLPLRFTSENERDFVKNSLIRDDIYPPILWDIEEFVPYEYIYEHELSKRMLTLPIDQRYKPEELSKAANIINQAYNQKIKQGQ